MVQRTLLEVVPMPQWVGRQQQRGHVEVQPGAQMMQPPTYGLPPDLAVAGPSGPSPEGDHWGEKSIPSLLNVGRKFMNSIARGSLFFVSKSNNYNF